ncbi:MAG: hypothetical protein KIT48_00385 [Pseudolabrys sp.]|nr:hypothetical protein [Pseudolabrys sp.]
MAKSLEFRVLAGTGTLVPTPLYVDETTLAAIVVGDQAKQWPAIRAMLDREGMPTARRAFGGLYYLPAQLKFFDKREGITRGDAYDFVADGPARFDR